VDDGHKYAQDYMIMLYGVAGGNARATTRFYAKRFPERERHPDYNVILRYSTCTGNGIGVADSTGYWWTAACSHK